MRLAQNSVSGLRRIDVLWVDDEVDHALIKLLGIAGVHVTMALTAAEGLRLAATGRFDVILLDLRLLDLFGLTALRRLRARRVTTPVVIVTGWYGEPEAEDDARRLGAAAFVRKPLLDADALADIVRAAAVPEPVSSPAPVPSLGIVASSAAMRDVVAWVDRVGASSLPVLLTGETGTGKEVVARALHDASGRRGRFMAVNCGAIPDHLFESELFGHAKGAYTGAAQAKAGLLEEAHGGTLFLDEVGDLPLLMQVGLLRVLDGDEVRRIGEARGKRLNLRVIAATNRDLRVDVARKRFREDLYYRLSGATRHLPPLRDRPDDIEAVARHWAAGYRTGGGAAVILGADAIRVLRAQRWPGNVRELRLTLERAACFLTGPVLGAREIEEALAEGRGLPLNPVSEKSNAARAEEALRAAGGNATRAAKLLGIGRATFYRWRRNGQF